MDESDASAKDPVLLSALVTEHFALQSVASSTISESGSRAAIYLSALSSGLVAIGFASSSPKILAVLSYTVLPTVFILGCFTMVRLIDTAVENIVALGRIERIRRYYAGLHPRAPEFFPAEGDAASGRHGVRYGRWAVLFTMASMITIVNAVLGGTTVALVCSLALRLGTGPSVVAGLIVGLALLALTLSYQVRRLRAVSSTATDAPVTPPV
jgi:hypothetical protein